MTEALPALIQSIGLIQANPQGIESVEVRLKLSTGEEHRVKLKPSDPILKQIEAGEHVLVVPVELPESEQQRFAIAPNYL